MLRGDAGGSGECDRGTPVGREYSPPGRVQAPRFESPMERGGETRPYRRATTSSPYRGATAGASTICSSPLPECSVAGQH